MAVLAILRDELLNDPLGLGYAGQTDQQATDTLNTENRPVDRDRVPTGEVMAAIRPGDFINVTGVPQQTYLKILLGIDFVLLGSTNIRNALANIFSGAPLTLAALAALQQELVSRGTELGIGFIHVGDVAEARI